MLYRTTDDVVDISKRMVSSGERMKETLIRFPRLENEKYRR